MRSSACLAAIWIFSLAASAQQSIDAKMRLDRENVAAILSFEGPPSPNGLPRGWSAPKGSQVALDTRVFHEGRQSIRIERTAASPSRLTLITLSIPADFAGKTIELRGYLRVEDVRGHAAIWLREDGAEGQLESFGNNDKDNFAGTSEWRQFCVSIQR